MNQRAFDKHFAQLTRHINDQLAHEQAWIEEQHSEKLTGRQAVAAAEIAVAWQAIADELDRGRAVSKERIEVLREALWQRELLGKPQSSVMKQPTSVVSPKMRAALASAARNNSGKVGTGAYGARDERHAPATIRALIERGLLAPCYGSEGEVAGALTAAGRALIEGAKKTSAQLDAEIAETLRKPTGHDPR